MDGQIAETYPGTDPSVKLKYKWCYHKKTEKQSFISTDRVIMSIGVRMLFYTSVCIIPPNTRATTHYYAALQLYIAVHLFGDSSHGVNMN